MINRKVLRKLINEEMEKMALATQPRGYEHKDGCKCNSCVKLSWNDEFDASQRHALHCDTDDDMLDEADLACGESEEIEENKDCYEDDAAMMPETWERIAFGKASEGFGIGMVSPQMLKESKKR
jgi:hypothetical protein